MLWCTKFILLRIKLFRGPVTHYNPSSILGSSRDFFMGTTIDRFDINKKNNFLNGRAHWEKFFFSFSIFYYISFYLLLKIFKIILKNQLFRTYLLKGSSTHLWSLVVIGQQYMDSKEVLLLREHFFPTA